MGKIEQHEQDQTAVDDVRRVRTQLHHQFSGDLRKIAQHANQTAEQYREKLGLKIANLPPRASRDGTAG